MTNRQNNTSNIPRKNINSVYEKIAGGKDIHYGNYVTLRLKANGKLTTTLAEKNIPEEIKNYFN